MKSLFSYILVFIINTVLATDTNPLNILAVFPYPGKSHYFIFQKYLDELAIRGHNVTVISHFPKKEPMKNYQDISLEGKMEILQDVLPIDLGFTIFLLLEGGVKTCQVLLQDEQVQNLWKTQKKYDVVVVDQFNSDCSLGLAHVLGAPTVALVSHVLMPWHYDRLGVPFNPSYVPFHFADTGTHPSLLDRIQLFIRNMYYNLAYKFYCQRYNQYTLAEYFDNVPPLEELARNIKMTLLYHNFVLTGSRLFPPNVKEVGGYHVNKPKELPGDLKKFIEESEHGIIYISFGSLFRGSSMSSEKLNAMISAFAELPQRVVWKYEEKSLPGNPKNIYVSKWLPQNDILAHPKVMAFISHCGLLGTTEAIHHGVPILAMPILGDQPHNAASIEESGLGVKLHIRNTNLTKEMLLEKLKIILDPKFRQRVKQISSAWHDRPISPLDNAVFWTEFAARNANLTFRSASADVPLYQYLCLDIITIFLTIFLALYFITKTFLKGFYKSQTSKIHKTVEHRPKKE